MRHEARFITQSTGLENMTAPTIFAIKQAHDFGRHISVIVLTSCQSNVQRIAKRSTHRWSESVRSDTPLWCEGQEFRDVDSRNFRFCEENTRDSGVCLIFVKRTIGNELLYRILVRSISKLGSDIILSDGVGYSRAVPCHDVEGGMILCATVKSTAHLVGHWKKVSACSHCNIGVLITFPRR